MSKWVLANPVLIAEWQQDNNKFLATNKNNIAAAESISDILTRLPNNPSLKNRCEIFEKLYSSTSYPLGLFLYGLALAEGYGCEEPDLETGNATIITAARVLQCKPAAKYLGLSYLNGRGIEQDFKKGIKHLQLAGKIAKSILDYIKHQLHNQSAKIQPELIREPQKLTLILNK